MSTRTDRNIWPGLTYVDALAARAWLAGLGFTEGILVTDESGQVVQHSEMIWPEGGRVMIHTHEDGADLPSSPGSGNVYVVTSDPEATHARATALGATFVRDMEKTDYGSLGFTIADAEGNAWSFGTYAGES